MGNALNRGDGISVSDLSAMESYYSNGVTSENESRTTSDDNSVVLTRQQLAERDSGGRESGGSRIRHGNSNSNSRSNSRLSGRPKKQHQQKSPQRYGINYVETDECRTETSSAYHHGYRMHTERRDDIELRDDGHHYGNSNNNNSSPSNHYVRNGNDMKGHQRDDNRYHRTSNRAKANNTTTTKNTSSPDHQHRHLISKMTSKTEGDGIETVVDIRPAETDMAWAGSEDDDENQANREKEINKYRYGAQNGPEEEDAQSIASSVPPEAFKNQQETRKQAMLEQDSEESLQQQQQRARLLLEGSQPESLRREGHPQKILREESETESLRSSSFSTLTKTIVTMPPKPKDDEDAAIKEKKHHAAIEKIPAQPVAEVTEFGKDDHNPLLEELLQQQKLQEEKLQKQLEQLRIQKERLQQLQEEKNHGTATKSVQDEASTGITQASHEARNDELRIQKERMRLVKAEPSRDGNSNLKNKVEEAKREQTRRQRLERARQKVMPKSPKHFALSSNNENIVDPTPRGSTNGKTNESERSEGKFAGGDSMSSEEQSTSTGTATGEMDESVPEWEDVPSQCGINENAPAPFRENDLTTLSASLTEDLLDESSTVSSMDEDPGLDDEQEKGDLDTLHEVVSSMDEEIDLVFVAKYDKAFNAFLDTYPAMFDKNSTLIQNLKVAKLQRILEVSYQVENDLEAIIETPSEAKSTLEAEQKLREASRRKAERSIELKKELNQLKKQSKAMEAKLTWDMLLLSLNRAKNLTKIQEELKNADATSRHDLLASLPDTNLMREVIKAVEAKPRESFGSKQKKELQQCQVETAILGGEVKVLQKKLAGLVNEAGHQEYLDTLLVRMDSKKLKRLKSRYQKKLGVSF